MLQGSQAMEADHFIHTVNDLLLRMSIGGSGYLCWARGRNLIAPSEHSLRTWLDLEPLLMFFICVVTTFLLTEISPSSFRVHRSLEIHAPVTPTDCWLHSGNSEKRNPLTLYKGIDFIKSIVRERILLFKRSSWFHRVYNQVPLKHLTRLKCKPNLVQFTFLLNVYFTFE